MSNVESLLAALSLREKVGQLNQRLYGWECVERSGDGYVLTEVFHAEAERWGGLGALYGTFRSDAWSGRSWQTGILPEHRAEVAAMVIEAARKYSPQGIPPLLVEEAPHGHQSLGGPLFPVNINVGSSWDPDLYEQCSAAVGHGLRASGVHIALVSCLDLLRDPRWGRSEECYTEDPVLAAELTRALVTGMQSSGVGVVLKHFVGQGEGVGGRNGHSATIGPRDLAELHFPAALAGVRSGAVGVMAAYNDIDGVPCCANRSLLTDLLRGEWGFTGIVMADGKAIDRLALMTGSMAGAARAALVAGVDMSLWDNAYTVLEDAVAADPSMESLVDDAVRRVLRVKESLGLFGDRSFVEPRPASAIQLSQKMVARSLVLLDNNGVLPLRTPARVVVVGPNADSTTAMLGDYVPPLRPEDERSVLDALRDRFDVVHVTGQVEHAVADADLVVCVLGGTSHRSFADEFADNGAIAGVTVANSGEGVDIADLELPNGQSELVRRVRTATRGAVVSVVIAGRPHVLTDVVKNSDATLLAWYPGPYGADEIVRVLVGESEPSGRLPVTLPSASGVVPVRYNDRLSARGVYVDVPEPILRPFGFGLGYRSSTVEGFTAKCELDTVEVEVRLGNDADADLDDVVQLFAHRVGGVQWPRERELLRFRRITIPAHGSATVHFDIPGDDAFAGPAGTTTLMIGAERLVVRRN